MAQCQEPRAQITLFFGLHQYLAKKYCENLKVSGAQLIVNPARAITWFVGVTIYCTFFNNNSPPPMGVGVQNDLGGTKVLPEK